MLPSGVPNLWLALFFFLYLQPLMFIAWIHEGLQNGDILTTSFILPLLVGILLQSETSPH